MSSNLDNELSILEVGKKRLKHIKEIEPNGYEIPYQLYCKINNIDSTNTTERNIYDSELIKSFSNMSDAAFEGYINLITITKNTNITDDSKNRIICAFKKAIEKNR